MAKSRKEPVAAAAEPPDEPEKPKIDRTEWPSHTVPADREESKAQRVLDELKQKSSEIVVRGLFAAPFDGVVLVHHVRQRLDDSVGIDGWGNEYKVLVPEPGLAILCALHVRIAGEWIIKCGVGVPIEGTAVSSTRTHQACENAFRAAAREFGIGWVAAAARTSPANEPAKPTANGKPAELTREQKDARTTELQKFWGLKILECATPEDLNTMLRGSEVKGIPDFAKRPVFDHIQAQAKEVGWNYDGETRSFFEPAKDDTPDAIPF